MTTSTATPPYSSYANNSNPMSTILSGGYTNEGDKIEQLRTLEREVIQYQEKYEKLKIDVSIKLKFLDENRVKVLRKQLQLFQHAIYMYCAGNVQSLDNVMKQYNGNGSSGLSEVSLKQHLQSIRTIDRNPDSTSTNVASTRLQSFLEQS